MPRPARPRIPGGFYHLTARGNRRHRIYMDNQDYSSFLHYLFQAAEKSNVRLFAWCLMPNHFHLLIETPQANVSEFMRRLLTRYAIRFNRRHQTVGHLFQGRFRSSICQRDRYFSTLIRYIHWNPVRSKIPLVSNLSDWQWSSHRFFLGLETVLTPSFAIQEVWNAFGKTRGESMQAYANFMSKRPDTMKKTNGQTLQILGDERFVEGVKKLMDKPIKNNKEHSWVPRDAEALQKRTCQLFNLSLEDFRSRDQTRRRTRIRRAFAYIGYRIFNFRVIDLARCINRDISTTSRLISNVNENQKEKETESLLRLQ